MHQIGIFVVILKTGSKYAVVFYRECSREFNKNNITQLKRKPVNKCSAPTPGGGDYGLVVQWLRNDVWRDYMDFSFKKWPMQEERPRRQNDANVQAKV
jgi:hypothetical protein